MAHKCKGTCAKDFADKAKNQPPATPPAPPANDQKKEEPKHKCCGQCKP